MKPTHNPFIRGAAFATLVFSPTVTQAAGIWDGTIGNFDVATNWDNDVVPTGIDVDVSNGGTIQVTSNHTTNDILAGTIPGSTGTWEQSAGNVTMGGGWFRLGTAAGATGTYNLSGGTLSTNGEQNVGEADGGTGIVNISGGTWNNNGAPFAIGGNSDAGGPILNNSGGTGTLNLSGTGILNNNNELWVGVGATAVGTMNISGGTINQRNWLAVGRSGGTGTLNMTGGIFNKTAVNSDATIIGSSGAGSGTFNQTGGAFNVAKGDTWIGETNTGIWRMSGGTANLQRLILGWEENGNGTLTLQSGASGMTGSLPNGGGNQVLTATELWLGVVATATGTMNLDGGTLAVNFVDSGVGSGTFNFNGGTLRATSTDAAFVVDVITLVKEGGAVIDSNGFDITVGTVLQHGGVAAMDGGLTKQGAGTLTFDESPTYAGDTRVTGGSVELFQASSFSDSSAVRLSNGGTLDLLVSGTDVVDRFSIDGVAQVAGTWGGLASTATHKTARITGDGILDVQNTETPFETQIALDALVGGNALPGADPDNDGYNNLAEFILGGEPNPATAGAGSSPPAPTVTASGGNHIFAFRRSQISTTQPGLTIGYEYGNDLVGWSTAPSVPDGVTVVGPSQIPAYTDFYGAGIDKVEVIVPDSLAPVGKRFVRMNAVLD